LSLTPQFSVINDPFQQYDESIRHSDIYNDRSMPILLVSVGLYLDITRITISEPGARSELVVDPEFGGEQMADSRALLVEVTVTTVDMASWSNDQFISTAVNLPRFHPVAGPRVADGAVESAVVFPQKFLGAEIDPQVCTIISGSADLFLPFRM